MTFFVILAGLVVAFGGWFFVYGIDAEEVDQ